MNPVTTLQVNLADRSYPIFIGQKVLSNIDCLRPYLSSNQVFIVSNETVAPLYQQQLEQLVHRACPDAQLHSVALADGESFKTLETVSSIWDGLMSARCNRKVTIIALGGGVVGDMAGFAAACFQRGVPFIQIPTTLLSQVDSSVGGKTGVNHPQGKNMIGAFHQPKSVLIDIDVLSTLSDREFSAGLAEVIKYGLIADAEFFVWLEENMDDFLARDTQILTHAIYRSCSIKAEVVAKDEYEGGIRAILNLGHTYGHAIETEMGYGEWLHGEAVAVGMIMACDLSVRLGWLERDILTRAKALISRAGLPVTPPDGMDAAAFMAHMRVDKKVLDGKVRLVLLKALGRAVVSSKFDIDVFEAQLSEL